MSIDGENPHDYGSRKYWAFEARRKKEIEDSKRRRESQKRSGRIYYYEQLGRLIHRGYPNGSIFDINTGELLWMKDNPSKFVRLCQEEAFRLRDQWFEQRRQSRSE